MIIFALAKKFSIEILFPLKLYVSLRHGFYDLLIHYFSTLCWFCHLQFLTLEIESQLAVGRLLFCSGTFQLTLTESWQSNRNLLLKVRKFQNEKSSRRIAQNMNEKIEKFCPKYSVQSFSNFLFIFWPMRRLHIFILKFPDLNPIREK